MKDVKQKHQQKLIEQKIQEEKEQEEKKKKNIEEAAAKPFKSNWRSTLTESEWYAIAGSGPTNSVSQTFAYGDPASGIEVTLSGLGGVEAHPSTVTIDGETYDAPTYNQLAMQGYAKPLRFNVNRRTDFQDVNPYLDASQEFAQRVGADYMMNARVQQTIRQEVETDLTKIAAKFDSSLIENMGQNIKLAVEAILNGQQPPLVAPPDPPFTGMSYEQMVDEQNKVNDKYNDLLAPLYKELNSYAGQLAPAGLVAKINALVEKQSQETNALYEKYSKYNQEYGDLLAKRADEWGKFVNAIEDYRKGFSFNPPSQEVAQVAGPVDSILDKVADMVDKKPAKKVFDYYNDVFLKNLSSNPPGSNPSNSVDMTKMMDKKEMNLIQSVVDTVMSDVNLTRQIDRENAMNDAFEELTKTIFTPSGIGFDFQSTATPNTRNIIGTLDRGKYDGFHIQKDGRVILRKSYDFDNKPGDNDFAASGGIGGIGASLYADYKGTPNYLPRGEVGETPTMHLQVVFNPARNKRNRSGERSQTSSLASQASSAVGLNPQQRRKRGIKTESTTWDRTKKHLKGA